MIVSRVYFLNNKAQSAIYCTRVCDFTIYRSFSVVSKRSDISSGSDVSLQNYIPLSDRSVSMVLNGTASYSKLSGRIDLFSNNKAVQYGEAFLIANTAADRLEFLIRPNIANTENSSFEQNSVGIHYDVIFTQNNSTINFSQVICSGNQIELSEAGVLGAQYRTKFILRDIKEVCHN